MSSQHYLTPALAWCLRDRTDMPPDIRDYFAATLALNRQRNTVLLNDLAGVVSTLQAIEIEPLLLKGAARLVDGTYPSPELRILGDLDLLVPAERAAAAAAALEAIGYEAPDGGTRPPAHHHLPALSHRDTGTHVELHIALSQPSYDAIILPEWLQENSRSCPLRHLRVLVPDPSRSIAHNVVHDQLNHRNHQARWVQLRQLFDLALIRKRHDVDIDWAEIDRRFCAAGMGEVLSTYLELGRGLFGQAVPPLSHAPRAGALAAFCRSVEWPSIRSAKALAIQAINAARALWRKPRRALKLFSPHAWVREFRATKSTLDKAKW